MKSKLSILTPACLLACLISFNPSSSFSQLTYPTIYPTAVIPNTGSGDILFFLYMPMEYTQYTGQDTFKLYYINKDTAQWRTYLAWSTNYGITWADTHLVNSDYQFESIIGNPDSISKYLAYVKWINENGGKASYMYKSVSQDGGFNFTNSSKVMALGEDKSFIWNEDEHEYWVYVRPKNIWPDCNCYVQNCYTIGNGVRKIALMKNNGFFPDSNSWTTRNIIVEIDTMDYINSSSPDYRTQPYYMQVFRSGSDWWGLVGMYRVGNNGGETNSIPYTDPEYTSDVELLWSDNGEDWYRTNNKQPFIALHDSIKTIYSVGTIVADSVYFYSSESTRLHAGYYTAGCGTENRTDSVSYFGKYYSIYLYKMGIDKLNEWRPSSVVNIYCAVEGFLDTATGKHRLRDTLTAELRNSTSPYAIASTAKSIIDSVTFLGTFNFPHVNPGNYYLVIHGRNSLETWSANSISISNSTDTSYDFTSSSSQAYGGNLVSKGSEYCIYSGDVDNDGFIQISTDVTTVYNDAVNFATGY